MASLPFLLRPRVAGQLLCVVLLATLAGWSVVRGVPETESSRFASQHTAAMRAAMIAIHRGKVDPAILAAMSDPNTDLVAIHRGSVDSETLVRLAAKSSVTRNGELVRASVSHDDLANQISNYLARPASEAPSGSPASQWEKAPPHRVVVASSAAAPEPTKADTSADTRTYVGQKTCEGCHQQEAANWAHTIHASVFTLNPRDANEARGCEACHGPGSAHVANPADLSTIISFSHKSQTPIPVQNGQCLSCHQGGPRIFWHGSIHEDNKLACSDCHNPMTNFAAHGLTARESINETCFSCHKVQRAQFHMRSHMPLPEGKITCVDCHNPHGSTTDPLLKADSVNDVCYGCHADKRGPFLFEHAPVRENCLNCHNPHGSNFESLLTAPRPMLCQQCHAQSGHPSQLMTRGNLAGGPDSGSAPDIDVVPDLPRQYPRFERSIGSTVRAMRTPVLIRRLGCVCAIALAAPSLAFADTGMLTGYGSAGNQLNPAGQPLDLPRDPDALSQLDEITRTPTGLLYPLPYALPGLTQSKADPDWWSMGWIRLGGVGTFGSDPGSALLNRYGEFSSGPPLGSAGFLLENHRTAYYLSGLLENAGRNDQYYQLNGGRYGEFNLTFFFDSVPHLYSTEARSIWNGAGTDNLTLRGGLIPGASTPAEVTAVANAAPLTELSVTREKAGVSVKYTPSKTWEIVTQLSNEWRDGTQPISATFGYPFENGATQIIQPIHYRTFDVATTARYKSDDGTMAANLIYTGSFFNNSLSALRWQNPGLAEVRTGSYLPPEGQLSLPPSNSFNSLKGDASVILSPDLRFSASASYGLMRQDDALLSPTIGTGIIPGAGGPIDLANWNTTAALSQLHAHAAIDVFNAFAQLQYSVTSKFKLDFELRDRNEMNHTNYLAYNPLTGQYGYIAIDGGLAPFSPLLSGVYQPNAHGSVVQIRNLPFANDNLQVTAKGDYRLDNHLKVEASYTHNSIEHSVREVPDASDNRFRLQLDANGFDWGTVRVSYEFGSLSGSDYVSNPYTPYYSTSLPGYIPKTPDGDPAFTLLNLRKFDVGDRTEHILHAQSNYIVSPRTDFQLSGNYKGDFYDAQYGLRASSSFDINADLNYQMSTATVLTGFFSYQSIHRSIANINAMGTVDNGAAGGTDYPLANAWHEQLASDNIAAGLTARQNWGKISLDGNYIFTHGDSAIGYTYASTAAFFNLLTATQAGSAFPDIVFDSHTLQANARYKASDTLSYILLYRFDYEHLDDFHYNGLAPVVSNNTYLGVIPENFTVQTVGFSVQYTF